MVLYVIVALVVVSLAAYIRIRSSPAYRQRATQVVIRQPGQRLLGRPEPMVLTGPEDLPFALLSQAAYQRKPDAKAMNAGLCVNADAVLMEMGWKRWESLDEGELAEKIKAVHLRVEVWWHAEQRKVAVAFGGTVFTNIKDWKANLRWFLPKDGNDEYTLIVRTYGEAFVEEYLNLIHSAGWQSVEHVHLFSTGHSLGGGLAQEFAYSLPKNENVPRVDKVYAFDPSPVTGFFSVEKNLREWNANNLFIDRIYERGEILAILRSLTNFIARPSANHPTIRQVRYNLFEDRHNPIAGHSIAELACKLYEQVQFMAEHTNPKLSALNRSGASSSI
jgi:pimeloyl-ACP methyl ester carboxylesterase